MPVDVVEIPNPLDLIADDAAAPLGARLLPASTGWVELHPRYRERLAARRLLTAEAFLDLPGEIVSGHPDRHVVRVEIPGWKAACFLKRQHCVGLRERFRQWRAGFGWSSRSVREARVLRELEREGFACPQWIAFGEDGNGRAFVLVEELSGAANLRQLLSDNRMSLGERAQLAERLGQAVAELHAAGFPTPDLAAKHVFANPETDAITLLDWQSSRRVPAGIPLPDRLRPLAALDASLADSLANRRDRFRCLWAYLRTARRTANQPRFAQLAREIERYSQRLQRRRSIRDQRHTPVTRGEQRLAWLAGEAVCAIPEIADSWPKPAIAAPFYDGPLAPDGAPIAIQLPDGRPAELLRGRLFQPFARLLASLRGQPWRSPGAAHGRLLFHLQRYGIPAPQLYAFGQRRTGPMTADWFVLHEPPLGRPLADWLARASDTPLRQEVLEQAAYLLRQLHDAGCRYTGRGPLFWVAEEGRVAIGSVRSVRIAKRVTPRDRDADRRAILGEFAADLPHPESCQ